MAGRDRGLQEVWSRIATERLGASERVEPSPDEELIPPGAILIEEQDRLARGARAGAQARGLDLEQRDEAVHLPLCRNELGEDPNQPESVLAERGPYPVIAGRRRVAFVEDEVDHFEHGREARRKLRPARDLERH